MLNLLSRPVNPGFQHVKLYQLVRADRELWTLLAQEITGSLKMDGNEVPLDKHVARLSIAPRVTMLLLPLPANQKVVEVPGKPSSCETSTKGLDQVQNACREELPGRVEAIHYEGRSRTNLLELQCYNVKDGCQLATSGKPAECSRGLHLCACCHKAGHSLVVCRDAKKG